jgi:hypothetical protein
VAELLTKIIQKAHQNVIFEVISEVQKDSEDVSAGIYIFFKVLIKFSCYLRSKSARSTLTSPGPIMVKLAHRYSEFAAGATLILQS